MSEAPVSNGFTNTDTLPEVGRVIIVRCHDDGRIAHLHGLVTDVTAAEGQCVIEHPEGVARLLWFPAVGAGWREAVDNDPFVLHALAQ